MLCSVVICWFYVENVKSQTITCQKENNSKGLNKWS